jgi:sporulation protein YlmC with PRC-barrel domain
MRAGGFVVLLLLVVLAVPDAWAQRAPSRPPSERGAPSQARDASADVLLSGSVIGARVKTRDGTDLGEIDQLVIDRRTGYVSHAILGVSGAAAGGETKVVVKWRDVRLVPDPSLPGRTIASVDPAVIERAPRLASIAEQESPEREPSASPPSGSPMPGGPGPRD